MSNEPDVVNNGALATMLGVVALSTLAVALVVTSLVRTETAEAQSRGNEGQSRAFRHMKAEQLTSISGAIGWKDQPKGLASVPIARSMQLVAEAVRMNPADLSPAPAVVEPVVSPSDSETQEGDETATGQAVPTKSISPTAPTQRTEPSKKAEPAKKVQPVKKPGSQPTQPPAVQP